MLSSMAGFGQKPTLDPAPSSVINMRTKKRLLWMFLLALLVVVGLRLRNEVRIDSCLDRGGSWDENRQICKGATE